MGRNNGKRSGQQFEAVLSRRQVCCRGMSKIGTPIWCTITAVIYMFLPIKILTGMTALLCLQHFTRPALLSGSTRCLVLHCPLSLTGIKYKHEVNKRFWIFTTQFKTEVTNFKSPQQERAFMVNKHAV